YALEMVACLLNSVSSKVVLKIPYEIRCGKTHSYKYLRVWGCATYVKQLVRDKLDMKSSLCEFVGYPKESIGYYFYDATKQRVFVSRNATFLEEEFLSDGSGNVVELEEA
ncbi:hypothetical protein Pfo_002058, partial [Paulownia fortunei]